MEAVLVPSTQNQNQPMNRYQQIRSQKRSSSVKRSFNHGSTGNIHGGVLLGHVPHPYHLSFSLPPPGNPVFGHQMLQRGQSEANPRQPPLLPLPVSRPYSSVPCRSNNRTASLTPKRPKQPVKRREDPKQPAKPSGPDPSDVHTDVSVDEFSGFVFTLSPPPSSLPLPRFLPRQKLSCRAEAAGVDTGATDNLLQMLRLR